MPTIYHNHVHRLPARRLATRARTVDGSGRRDFSDSGLVGAVPASISGLSRLTGLYALSRPQAKVALWCTACLGAQSRAFAVHAHTYVCSCLSACVGAPNCVRTRPFPYLLFQTAWRAAA